MPFFSFGKKSGLHKSYSLDQFPLFSDLSSGDIKAVEKRARLVEFHKGDRVYCQGDEPEAFYLILSGRFQVLQGRQDGTEEKVINLYRGDYFGEISILTNRPHSVTVEALNDALTIRIGRGDFTKILSEIPSLSLHLSRLLGRRLAEKEERREVEHAEIISLYNLRSGVGKTSFITNLSVALQTELNRKAIMVNMNPPAIDERAPKGTFAIEDVDMGKMSSLEKHVFRHAVGFDYMNVIQTKQASEETEQRITVLLMFLVSRYEFVLVDLPREIQDLAYKVLAQSDAVYLLTDDETENLEKCRSLISELKKTFYHTEGRIKLLLSERGKSDRLTMRQCEHVAGHRVFSKLPYVEGLKDNPADTEHPYVLREPSSNYNKTVRYLARDLGNSLVGLALGSGAAFGLAHIGVLKVLEEERIPVDVISGSSIGSLIGALWAKGMPAKEIEALALSFNPKNSFFRLVGFADIMIPHWGIFKGNKLEAFLRQFLGRTTFQDLKTTLRIVATNLATSDAEVFEEGDVVKAVRASCSIPGIFRAVRHGGKILVDGGIADPLPVSVLADMGVKKIIAVNVLSGPSDHMQRMEVFKRKRELLEQQFTEKNAWSRMWYEFQRKFIQSQSHNIFNVLMSTIQLMEFKIASGAGVDADVMIHPVVVNAHWAEFYSAEKFIRNGEETTREALKDIHALLES